MTETPSVSIKNIETAQANMLSKYIGDGAFNEMIANGQISVEGGKIKLGTGDGGELQELTEEDFKDNGKLFYEKLGTLDTTPEIQTSINNFLKDGIKKTNPTSAEVRKTAAQSVTEVGKNPEQLMGTPVEGKLPERVQGRNISPPDKVDTKATKPGPRPGPGSSTELVDKWEKQYSDYVQTRTFFEACMDNTVALIKKIADPKVLTVGAVALIGGLSLLALNEMASANNGCYMFNDKTGDQMQPIIGVEPGRKCNCSSTNVFQKCHDRCGEVLGLNNVQVCGGITDPTLLDANTASSVCQCTDPDGKKRPSTDFSVHTVNDNAFTMFAKVLAAGGLAITGLIGTGEDIAMQVAATASGLAADVKLVLIIGGVVAGVVILVLAFYFIFSGKRRAEANKKLLAAAQAPPPSVVIGASPSPGQTPFPAPIGSPGSQTGSGSTSVTVLSVAAPRNLPTSLPPSQSSKDMVKPGNFLQNIGALSAGGGSHSWRSGLRGGGKWNGYAIQMM